MSNQRGKASPNLHTIKWLFADSGGYCQNPNCNMKLFESFDTSKFHIAEMAHIISAGDSGPRTDNDIDKESKGDFYNLIILCPSCHTKIDKAEELYPQSLLLKWKKEHSEKIQGLFDIEIFSKREEVRAVLTPLLNENKSIFNIYGSMTDERFNPESEMPKRWKSKILEKILPNNRKIQNIIERNYKLLRETEITIFEEFKQHVDDFEAKHKFNVDINAKQFPLEMNNIYKD